MSEARQYLVVDDNCAFGDNLVEILEDAGGIATLASSAADALRAVKARRFSALLTDMRMPLMSGAGLVHELRRVDPGLPAVVMTAYTADDDLEVARAEGVLAVLPKPVPLQTLLAYLTHARRGGLVVVVDGDADLRDLLGELLRADGYTAVMASSLLEAEQLTCARPFAALVDLRMPGGKNGEAMRTLATRFPGVPLIAVTAHPDLRPPVPAAGYFVKPFEVSALLRLLDTLYRATPSAP